MTRFADVPQNASSRCVLRGGQARQHNRTYAGRTARHGIVAPQHYPGRSGRRGRRHITELPGDDWHRHDGNRGRSGRFLPRKKVSAADVVSVWLLE